MLVLDAEVSRGEFADVIRRGRCGREDVIASRTGRPEDTIGQAPRVDAAGIHRNIHGNEGHLRLLIGLGKDVHRAIGEQGANQAEARIGQDHGCGVRIDERWGHRLTGVEELATVVIRDVEDHGVGDGGLQDLVTGGRAGALTEGGRCVVSTRCGGTHDLIGKGLPVEEGIEEFCERSASRILGVEGHKTDLGLHFIRNRGGRDRARRGVESQSGCHLFEEVGRNRLHGDAGVAFTDFVARRIPGGESAFLINAKTGRFEEGHVGEALDDGLGVVQVEDVGSSIAEVDLGIILGLIEVP